ncbi:hypothetical protein AFM18_23265 [Achromobacter spanius]|uniref:Uncharacterized protein n=1 Tax=Achromobacter spanius TaxID=217203 RepID=A0AAW3HY21_9BURK|nr:hypothetical protein AFM18_23265 [Achromobacter spanius]
MLPQKIRDFVYQLISMTEGGKLSWKFSSSISEALLNHAEYRIRLRYQFDGDSGLGSFIFSYQDRTRDQDFRFSATQEEADDFFLLDRLYQQAQASAMRLPF